MSVLTLNPEIFTAMYNKMLDFSFRTQCDINYCYSASKLFKEGEESVMPNLLINNQGKITLIPVTNLQFMGSDALQRKTIWL